MSAPMIPDVNEPEDQTFGDIVWIQFKKNRVAYWSLWGIPVFHCDHRADYLKWSALQLEHWGRNHIPLV